MWRQSFLSCHRPSLSTSKPSTSLPHFPVSPETQTMGLVPTNLPWQAMGLCRWGSGTSKEVVWVGHGREGGSGGQRRRCVQGPTHHKGLQGDLLLRQHNWLREPPLARYSPSKGGDRPSRSHSGQRPCLSSHLPGGRKVLHSCSSNHDLLGGLPAGRRWQVGLVVGRWPVPPRAAA